MPYTIKLLTLTVSFFVSVSVLAETVNFSVTSPDGYYYIDGEKQKELTLIPGNTYVFNGIPSNHPLRFSTTDNGTFGGGSIYTDGVTVNSSSGTVTIFVDENTPDLYYFCLYHSWGMGSSAQVASVIEEEFEAENVPMMGSYFTFLFGGILLSLRFFVQRMKKSVI